MPKKVTYWLCSRSHHHLSPKDADLCDNPYRGDEIVQWMYFEVGEKLVQFPYQALSCHPLAHNPKDLPIWVVTEVETKEAHSRPGPEYRFERAFYTLISSDGNVEKVRGKDLQMFWTRIRSTRRVLLAYLKKQRRKGRLVPAEKEITEVVRVVTEKARGFNPHLKHIKD